MFIIDRQIEIDAGHRVPYHDSKCKHLHGHRWKIVASVMSHVTVTPNPARADSGMVMDFGQIKRILIEEIHDRFDHKLILWDQDPLLDHTAFFETLDELDILLHGVIQVPVIPTSELLAEYWGAIVAARLDRLGIQLNALTVWETPNCKATWQHPRPKSNLHLMESGEEMERPAGEDKRQGDESGSTMAATESVTDSGASGQTQKGQAERSQDPEAITPQRPNSVTAAPAGSGAALRDICDAFLSPWIRGLSAQDYNQVLDELAAALAAREPGNIELAVSPAVALLENALGLLQPYDYRREPAAREPSEAQVEAAAQVLANHFFEVRFGHKPHGYPAAVQLIDIDLAGAVLRAAAQEE